jgi:hypothetical protein
MAHKQKAPKQKLDRAQEKERKQKRLAAVLGAVLLLVLVYEVPHTMSIMNKKAKAPVVETSVATAPTPSPGATTTPTPNGTGSAPASGGSPTPSSVAPSSLVSAVQPVPDPGQLTQFEQFASKDPFAQSVQKTVAPASSSGGTAAPTPAAGKKKTRTATTPTPPEPAPTSAVISVNGQFASVSVGTDFPAATPFFHLVSLTARSAKIAIAGGSYADGAPSLTLTVGRPVTLQNTADGKRYTLILEPQGTTMPASTSASAPTSTTTTVVPPSSSGG